MNDFFPTICIDNFFDDPDTIAKLATFYEYYPSDDGTWPGVRTKELSDLCRPVFDKFFAKLFSIYYDYEEIKWNASLFFQKIKSYEVPEFNIGWVHNDLPTIFGGLVYLTPNNNPLAGTSIFSCLDETKYNSEELDDSQKKLLYLTPDKINVDEYKKAYNNYHQYFAETALFQNKYNRLISYDGNTYHRANLFDGSEDEERLTLVFFVHQITSKTVPLLRNELL